MTIGRDKANMAEEMRLLSLSDYEQRLIVRSLTDFRNDILRNGKPAEDVENLILKVIDAPMAEHPRNRRFHGKRRADHEAR